MFATPCFNSLCKVNSPVNEGTMSSPGTEEKKGVVDPEAISHHVETYNFIDEEELKGDVDIGVVALRGQDLSFTEEGEFGVN